MAVSPNPAPRNYRIPKVLVQNILRVENPSAAVGEFLMIAPKITAGVGLVNRTYAVATESNAIRLFGSGSIAHRMFRSWKAQSPFSAVQVMVLADAGTKRVITLTFSTNVTTAGTARLTIGSDTVQVDLAANDTPASVATKFNEAIVGFEIPLQFTSAASGAVLTLTAKNGGVVNNSVGISVDLMDVGGVTAAVANSTPGSGDYSYASVESSISDDLFDVIVPLRQRRVGRRHSCAAA